MNGIDEIREE